MTVADDFCCASTGAEELVAGAGVLEGAGLAPLASDGSAGVFGAGGACGLVGAPGDSDGMGTVSADAGTVAPSIRSKTTTIVCLNRISFPGLEVKNSRRSKTQEHTQP